MCLQIIFYMDKLDLALNNLQWLICHKTQSNPNLTQGHLCEAKHEQLFFRIWSWFANSISYNDTNVKEPSLPDYLHIAGSRIAGCIPFPNGLSATWNVNSFIQNLNSGHC